MKKYIVRYTVMISKKQYESLYKLKNCDVNISQFIRTSIKEKLLRDWKQIKESKETFKIPF